MMSKEAFKELFIKHKKHINKENCGAEALGVISANVWMFESKIRSVDECCLL